MRRNALRSLRGVRRKLADARNVPAYVIFSDVALREMARSYPTTAAEFRRIPGVGEQKLKDFAEPFLARSPITWTRTLGNLFSRLRMRAPAESA